MSVPVELVKVDLTKLYKALQGAGASAPAPLGLASVGSKMVSAEFTLDEFQEHVNNLSLDVDILRAVFNKVSEKEQARLQRAIWIVNEKKGDEKTFGAEVLVKMSSRILIDKAISRINAHDELKFFQDILEEATNDQKVKEAFELLEPLFQTQIRRILTRSKVSFSENPRSKAVKGAVQALLLHYEI